MEIRKANENDIPKIVEVLKASLGEELELSEKVWTYKHIKNPFGSSVVFVALEDQNIVGVRAFMCWEWQLGQKKYPALRAVDTATHPDHQGKGIFKKLTLEAVQYSKTDNDQFIFNTPNEQSRPGYLKMGWEQVGKIKVGIKPSFSFLSSKRKSLNYEIKRNIPLADVEKLCNHWNLKLIEQNKIFTPKSPDMLQWRYEKNPLQAYEVLADQGFYIASYIKKRGKVRELRIAECLYDENLVTINDLYKIVRNIASRIKCHVITFSPNLLELKSIKGHFGPILTFNSLNLKEEEYFKCMEIENWNNSIGDLELF